MGQIHITIDDKYKLTYKSLDPNKKKELQVAVRTIVREFFAGLESINRVETLVNDNIVVPNKQIVGREL